MATTPQEISLNPILRKDSKAVWWLDWTQDTRAIAYDIITPAGVHVQAGKGATSAKLGKLAEPFTMPQIAAAYAVNYQSPVNPFEPAPEPPEPIPPEPVPAGIDAFKGLCMYKDADLVKARDLVGCKYVRRDWASASFVTAAKNVGIEVMPIACYAHGAGGVDHAPPTDWEKWLTALKNDYNGAWQRPKAVEIWNEPWHKEFWQPTPDPAGYMNMVERAANALWSVNPDCLIVVSADHKGHTNTSGTDVWRANVIKADTDGLLADPRIRPSTHNYCEARTPNNNYTGDGHCSWDMQRYDCAYNDYKAHGHPNPMVWGTEAGWEVNEGTHYFGTVTEAQQADYIAQSIKIIQESGLVERWFWFYMKSDDPWSYNWLDLNTNDPRPVCAKVKALT
jgi:hypothetical protein